MQRTAVGRIYTISNMILYWNLITKYELFISEGVTVLNEKQPNSFFLFFYLLLTRGKKWTRLNYFPCPGLVAGGGGNLAEKSPGLTRTEPRTCRRKCVGLWVYISQMRGVLYHCTCIEADYGLSFKEGWSEAAKREHPLRFAFVNSSFLCCLRPCLENLPSPSGLILGRRGD